MPSLVGGTAEGRGTVNSSCVTLALCPFDFLVSLEATIKSVRPDLLKEVDTDLNAIIPSKPPLNFMNGHKVKLDDIGEPITACFFTMSNFDPKDWLV